MKKFDHIFFIMALLFLAALAGMNLVMIKSTKELPNKEHRVALARVEKEIASFEQEEKRAPLNIKELREKYGNLYDSCILDITSVKRAENTDEIFAAWSAGETEEYRFFITEEYLYKIRYVYSSKNTSELLIYADMTAVILFVMLLLFFLYVRHNILKPFHALSDLPYEIAKGHLTKPLPESKNRYFGRYLWGMDMLRENLEEHRMRGLHLQKEKKLLLLSLSHDIKTPLMAISLYAKAISKNLYRDEKKKAESAEKIHEKVNEIESYMAEIIRASNQDFLTFEVENAEFYSREVLDYIREYYTDKMELNQIEFSMAACRNCLLYGDKDRLTEVLQNIVENAVKYGDGRRIRVTAQRLYEEYEISVLNTGCTLPETELTHIFDSFFRGSNVGKKTGSGLGLAICRRLMHLMEGEILAEIRKEENERMMEIRIVLRAL